MSKLNLLICAFTLALVSLTGPASAQYIYLDANGDGISTPADTLNPTGPTVLTIYLNTNHDKDGSLQTCNSHSAANCGATPSPQPLTLFSYQVYLSAVGGTVTWGTFTPDSSAFTTLQSQLQDTHDVEFTFARQPAGSFSPPGLLSLGKIPLTITSGLPAITFPRFPNTPLDPSSFGTTFGTNCVAFTFGNSYVLGDRADSCGAVSGIPSDWYDADGVAGPQNLPPSIEAPTTATGAEGAPLVIFVVADDPNHEPIESLTADLSALPPGNNAAFNTTSDHRNGTLTWTPTSSDAGEYNVRFEARNSLSVEATTAASVADESTALAVRSLRLQFPLGAGYLGYKVDVRVYDTACSATGGLCSTTAYFTGDSGQIYVPLMRCFSPTSCAWWDRVLISFPMWTPAVWVSTGSFSPTLDLHPYSNPSDRGYNYAVPYDPDIVDLFNLFGRVKRFYERTYNYSLQSTELKNSPGEEYSADFDYINFEFDPGIWASSNGGFGWRAQVAGHEYFHAIDDAISDSPPFCTEANGVLGIVGAAGCVVHTSCTQGQSFLGSFSEGLADANGVLFAQSEGYSQSSEPCWTVNPDLKGGFYEGNNETLWYRMAQYDPQGTFNTYRYGRLTNAQGQARRAITGDEFYALSMDFNPSPDWTIAVHHPSTWNTSGVYQWVFWHNVLAGVEGRTDPDPTRWLRSVRPSPAATLITAHCVIPSSRDVTLQLFDVRGRSVRSQRYTGLGSGEVDLPFSVSGLSSGVYYLRYQDNGKWPLTLGTRSVVILR